MPNWCENSLSVKGDKESLSHFMTAIQKDNEIDFTLLVPRPSDKDEDWYNWNYDNWGTKWAPSEIQLQSISENSAEFLFVTPWGTSDRLFTNIAAIYPTLDFTLSYSESGMGFCGAIRWTDGKVSGDCHVSDYTADPRLAHFRDKEKYTDEDYEFMCDIENTIRNECIEAVGG